MIMQFLDKLRSVFKTPKQRYIETLEEIIRTQRAELEERTKYELGLVEIIGDKIMLVNKKLAKIERIVHELEKKEE